jgi:nicotinate-nucleotide adenylyltransferase
MQQQILVFGGAFNPPTIAHEAVIAQCLLLPQFNEVWLLPSGDREDKRMHVRDAHRLHMLQLMHAARFGNNPRLRIVDFELRLPRPNATYKTVPALRAAYPGTTFWWAFGADSYMSMQSWPHGEALQHDLDNLVLFDRGKSPQVVGKQVIHLAIPGDFSSVSSTAVRRAVREHTPIARYVNPVVAAYILRHKLY